MRHNHFTRDVKAPGLCPACDESNRAYGLMPPIPEELCGVRGITSETRSRVALGGGCVFLKGHYELEGQEKHSWQQ